ncbi:MAG: hypothetical protein R3A52_26745 [Polyangiales bacterium]
MPRPPSFVKCSHCAQCYWLSDAEEVGSVDVWDRGPDSKHPEWSAARYVEEPTEDEYYQHLASASPVDPERERDLRILAWWRGNDAIRRASDSARSAIPATGSSRANLVALSALLNEDDENDHVMKAEVLRELGDFDAARTTLATVTSEGYSPVVTQLRALCDAGDASVRELKFPR